MSRAAELASLRECARVLRTVLDAGTPPNRIDMDALHDLVPCSCERVHSDDECEHCAAWHNLECARVELLHKRWVSTEDTFVRWALLKAYHARPYYMLRVPGFVLGMFTLLENILEQTPDSFYTYEYHLALEFLKDIGKSCVSEPKVAVYIERPGDEDTGRVCAAAVGADRICAWSDAMARTSDTMFTFTHTAPERMLSSAWKERHFATPPTDCIGAVFNVQSVMRSSSGVFAANLTPDPSTHAHRVVVWGKVVDAAGVPLTTGYVTAPVHRTLRLPRPPPEKNVIVLARRARGGAYSIHALGARVTREIVDAALDRMGAELAYPSTVEAVESARAAIGSAYASVLDSLKRAREEETTALEGGCASAPQTLQRACKRARAAVEQVSAVAEACAVCGEHGRKPALVPCGHAKTCGACVDRILDASDEATCPVCRKPIKSVLTLYL